MLDKVAADHQSGADKQPAIVVIGRTHNANDTGINLYLQRKIAQMGYRVIPVDLLPFDPERIHPKCQNTFWSLASASWRRSSRRATGKTSSRSTSQLVA